MTSLNQAQGKSSSFYVCLSVRSLAPKRFDRLVLNSTVESDNRLTSTPLLKTDINSDFFKVLMTVRSFHCFSLLSFRPYFRKKLSYCECYQGITKTLDCETFTDPELNAYEGFSRLIKQYVCNCLCICTLAIKFFLCYYEIFV